jgi:hypothetical protein
LSRRCLRWRRRRGRAVARLGAPPLADLAQRDDDEGAAAHVRQAGALGPRRARVHGMRAEYASPMPARRPCGMRSKLLQHRHVCGERSPLRHGRCGEAHGECITAGDNRDEIHTSHFAMQQSYSSLHLLSRMLCARNIGGDSREVCGATGGRAAQSRGSAAQGARNRRDGGGELSMRARGRGLGRESQCSAS